MSSRTSRYYASSPQVELALVRANGSGGGGSSSGPLGAIQLSDGSGGFTADNANFHYDTAAHKLGIGTTAPFAQLSIVGNGAIGSGLFLDDGQLDVNATIDSHITVTGAQLTLDTIGIGGGIQIFAQISDITIDAGGSIDIGVTDAQIINFTTAGLLKGTFTTTAFQITDCSFSLTGNATSSITTTVGNISVNPAAVLNLGTATTTNIAIGHGTSIPITIAGGSIAITGGPVSISANVTSAFILDITNTEDSAGGFGVRMSVGSNVDVGSELFTVIRPDSTALMNINQTAVDAVSILPGADNTGAIGSNALRWALVRATVVTTGDLEMISEERNAHWIIQEESDCIAVFNKKTNTKFRMVLEPY
jgi:hypothetical protein